MFWPSLTILAVAVAIGIYLFWQKKFTRLERKVEGEIEAFQRHQQQTTIDAKAQQQVLFNSMLEGLLLLDRSRKIYLANRAFKNLFGIKAELRGKTVMEVLRLHELAELVERAESEKQVFDYELKVPELNERWLQVNAAVISNSAGEREGTILVFHDLTRLKQLERTREEFVANVSHELRTPLSLIKGYVETLLDGARNNPDVAEHFLRIIARNTERLDLLIQDLLTISALESGRVQINLQPVSLRALAEKVFADLKSRAAAREVTLKNELPDLVANADEGRLDIRCWPISWTMRLNMAAPMAVSLSAAKVWTVTKLKFSSRTMAPAFLPSHWIASSSAFIVWTRRVPGSRAVPAWASPS